MQLPDTCSQMLPLGTQPPCCEEAQVLQRSHMYAVWLTVPTERSLHVIPTQVPDTEWRSSSPQPFPGCTLINFLTLRTCEQSDFFIPHFGTMTLKPKEGLWHIRSYSTGKWWNSTKIQPSQFSVQSSFHDLLFNKCLLFTWTTHILGHQGEKTVTLAYSSWVQNKDQQMDITERLITIQCKWD